MWLNAAHMFCRIHNFDCHNAQMNSDGTDLWSSPHHSRYCCFCCGRLLLTSSLSSYHCVCTICNILICAVFKSKILHSFINKLIILYTTRRWGRRWDPQLFSPALHRLVGRHLRLLVLYTCCDYHTFILHTHTNGIYGHLVFFLYKRATLTSVLFARKTMHPLHI